MLLDHDTPSSTPTRRVPLTLISGMATTAADQLAAAFRAMPGTAVVHHNLRQVTHGVVRRLVQFGAHEETTVLELAHGCVSCTLREDLLPLLRSLAQRPQVTASRCGWTRRWSPSRSATPCTTCWSATDRCRTSSTSMQSSPRST